MSDRSKAILAFIVEFKEQNGYAPSFREIAKALNISSTGLVEYWIIKMEIRGMIKRTNNKSRTIVVIEEAPKQK